MIDYTYDTAGNRSTMTDLNLTGHTFAITSFLHSLIVHISW